MAEINCYGIIDQQYSATLRHAIAKVPLHEPIELHISSPGGELSAGVTCYNLLRHAKHDVLGYMDGDAFSAATLLVCGCQSVEMPSNTLLMIHEPWVPMIAPGTLEECRKTGDYLRHTLAQVAEIYAERTGLGTDQLVDMMHAETYLSAQEALGLGFVTNVTAPARNLQLRPLDDYRVRDPERLAKMFAQRIIPRDVSEILSKIGV